MNDPVPTLRRREFTSVLALSPIAAALPTFAQTASGDPRKLGFLMPLTGAFAKLGQLMLEGSTVAVEEINAAGGVAGRPVALVVEDSQGLARQGIDGFRKLVDVDRVDVIITGWTAVVVAIGPMAAQSKVMLFSASTASPALRGVSPYFQATWMFDDETVKLLLPYAKDTLKVQRLAVMTILNDLGSGLSASVRREWPKTGFAVVAEESFAPAETNFRPNLLKLLEAKPDAIYLTTSGKQPAQIIRQARDLGYKGLFLSYGGFEDPEVIAIGERAHGSYYTSPVYEPESSAQAKRFVDAFQKKYSRAPNVHQANHYDLVYLYRTIIEGIAKQNKPINGTAVHDYLKANLGQHQGAAGKYVFDFSDGSVVRSTMVKTVKDGQFVKVADLR